MSEALARRFFQQLIFALDFCQRQGIANRSVTSQPSLAGPLCAQSYPGLLLILLCSRH